MPSGIKTEEVVPSPSGEGGWPKARRMRCSMNRIERIQAMEAFLNETSDAEYTGRAALYKITSVVPDTDFPDGIKSGYAVIGIQPMTGIYDDYGRGK